MSLDNLWVPPGTRLAPRATLPDGDIRLGRRTIKLLGRFGNPNPVQPGEVGQGRQWVEHPDRPRHRGLGIIATIDVTDHWGPLLHVSMSYDDHDPPWVEIRAIKDYFYGDQRDAMMVLPKKRDYVNLHPHAFHLWETPEPWDIQ